MKKTLLQLTVGCALALAIAPSAQAQVLASDPFLTGGSNYTVGNITGQNPTVTGFTGAWFQDIGSNNGSVTATPLSYSGTTGYSQTAGGGALNQSVQDSRSGRALTAPVVSALTATSGTVYMSFLMKLPSVAGYQAVELGNNADTQRFLQIGYSSFGDFSNSTNFGVTLNSTGGGGITGSLGVADTNTHLFLLQLNLGSGSTDTMSVWEDPTSVTGGVVVSSGLQVNLSGFSVAQTPNFLDIGNFGGGSAGYQVGEVRIGQTLADVTVPEVPTSTMAFLGLGALVVMMIRRRKMVA